MFFIGRDQAARHTSRLASVVVRMIVGEQNANKRHGRPLAFEDLPGKYRVSGSFVSWDL